MSSGECCVRFEERDSALHVDCLKADCVRKICEDILMGILTVFILVCIVALYFGLAKVIELNM